MATTVVNQPGLTRSAKLVMDDISHTAVGTGTTLPNIANTTLVTETNRLATLKTIQDENLFQQRTFFTNAALPSPNVEEIGWFMNGTGTPGSGSLLARTVAQFVKGTSDLLVVLEITIQEDLQE